MLIDCVSSADRDHLVRIAVSTGLFTPEEAEALLGDVLDGLAAATLPPGHTAVCCRRHPGEPAVGWSYFAPDPHASGIWNLWWIGVSPEHHGTGAGRLLLRGVEGEVAALGGRILIIETSAADALARARRFYAAQGYLECGRVPDFYAEGEAKVIFARRPRARDTGSSRADAACRVD